LSRKQKGSKARNRARLDVARVHRKVANVRNDWQWKQARMLLLTFDLLAFETPNLKGMQQLWGRKVGDLGFADFLRKAEWLARKLVRDLLKIDQWEPTTKSCHLCGHRQDMQLNMRRFECRSGAFNCLPVRRRLSKRPPRNPVARKNGRHHPRRPEKAVRPEGLRSDEGGN
jgi:putative transposase